MRLISLRKYLDQTGGNPGSQCSMPCLGFAGLLLADPWPGGGGEEAVDAEAFERDTGVREQVFERTLEKLQRWKAEQARREAETREDMQRLLAAFNRAVMALADGGEKAAGRFSRIGQTLERAARADSLSAMRAAVYEAAEQLKRESEAQRVETAAQVEALGKRLEEARQKTGAEARRAGEARGREAAIQALREAEASGAKAAVAGVVFDRLGALESRFGRQVAGEALSTFEAERIAGLTLGGAVYSWTPQMRVWLVDASGDAEAVRERLEAALGAPFEYRTIAGGRVVMLALEGRWMWGLLGRMTLEALIEEVDLFAAGTPTRR